MNMHSSFTQPGTGTLPTSGRPEFGQASASAMSMKWSALHDAVNVVGMLAGLAAEPARPEIRNFPAVMRDTGGWRRALAEACPNSGRPEVGSVPVPGCVKLECMFMASPIAPRRLPNC